VGELKVFKFLNTTRPARQKTPLRSLLKGQEAKPTGKDTVAISGLRIECYDREGKTNTVVSTSECSYEISKKTVFQRHP
jgi:hypothetical protein